MVGICGETLTTVTRCKPCGHGFRRGTVGRDARPGRQEVGSRGLGWDIRCVSAFQGWSGSVTLISQDPMARHSHDSVEAVMGLIGRMGR